MTTVTKSPPSGPTTEEITTMSFAGSLLFGVMLLIVGEGTLDQGAREALSSPSAPAAFA